MIRLLFVFIFISTLSTNIFGQFQVSENRRFITREGKPFFWLGDTAWELFHRLDEKEAKFYLDKRQEQGFNVIQAVVLAELDGIHSPNANGDVPFTNLETASAREMFCF